MAKMIMVSKSRAKKGGKKTTKSRTIANTPKGGCNCGCNGNGKKTIEDETMGIIGFGAKAAIGVGVLGAIGGMFNK